MISDARGGHVSPGIYTEEKDVTYSVKSLGITSLGLVGETLYGPAFENIPIENWSEFVDYFGGTSPEKFKGTGLPKYELPYIAKSYLEESKRLNVVRVLGLSGYNAGPFWAVKDTDGTPVVILRSKMEYGTPVSGHCYGQEDVPTAVVSGITIGKYEEKMYNAVCEGVSGSSTTIDSDKNFKLTVACKDNKSFEYNVSLEPSHPNYIYNVLSNRPDTGTTDIYVEAVYEGAFNGKIDTTASGITSGSSEMYTDYREAYRHAYTPWLVSEANVIVTNSTEKTTKDVPTSGDTTTTGETEESKSAYMKRLFRFVTISDGNVANYQVKVSIENIKPEDGTFDVVVRDFYDTDANPMVLEKFSRCNLVDGDANYIAYRIGTSDGGFVSKSKYILVEMYDSEDLRNSIPAGFMGYPIPDYGTNKEIKMLYNTEYKREVKAKKQYFGISNLTGIDMDMLSYKGKMIHGENGENERLYMQNGFHMDSSVGSADKVYVDGESGFSFTSVSADKVSSEMYAPRLINADYIDETIYKDIKVRKFTVCFYGGFDGWDVNRTSRTNTDDYKASKYSMSGSSAFTDVADPRVNLPSTAITSDYYAYLAGYRVFANPQDVDINLFATPGINWFDHTLLTEEAIDMIEDSEDGRGGDALYIMACPFEMDATQIAETFAETEINSSYACTYAPWVMYYDASNRKYLNLPVTKDVVRNMAATDNNSYPWFAPAGIERGNVKCVKAEYKTTLANEDELYENRVNPVKSFAQDGVKIWGNKTAYDIESPLNRINVRRLMIRVKKLVTNAAKNLIFTQYDDTLEKQFRGLIEPILAEVKSNRGISDYRIMTEVTPETRDQHILPAKILIKPTPALEYISISFVVYPESVSFDEN